MSRRSAASRPDAAPSTPATVALTIAGIAFTPHNYAHDSGITAFGAEAAAELRVEAGRVFKTLLVEADGSLMIGIVPVTGQLDLKAFAAHVGAKRATMADRALAERKTGYVVGGISPIGTRTVLRTVLDQSAELFDTVFVSGGRRGFDIELTSTDLMSATNATIGSIGW